MQNFSILGRQSTEKTDIFRTASFLYVGGLELTAIAEARYSILHSVKSECLIYAQTQDAHRKAPTTLEGATTRARSSSEQSGCMPLIGRIPVKNINTDSDRRLVVNRSKTIKSD